jgi:hypothetical protein
MRSSSMQEILTLRQRGQARKSPTLSFPVRSGRVWPHIRPVIVDPSSSRGMSNSARSVSGSPQATAPHSVWNCRVIGPGGRCVECSGRADCLADGSRGRRRATAVREPARATGLAVARPAGRLGDLPRVVHASQGRRAARGCCGPGLDGGHPSHSHHCLRCSLPRVGTYLPPAWPPEVAAPGTADFRQSARAWLWTLVPSGYHDHQVLRDHPSVVVVLARHLLVARFKAARAGYRTAATQLAAHMPPHQGAGGTGCLQGGRRTARRGRKRPGPGGPGDARGGAHPEAGCPGAVVSLTVLTDDHTGRLIAGRGRLAAGGDAGCVSDDLPAAVPDCRHVSGELLDVPDCGCGQLPC